MIAPPRTGNPLGYPTLVAALAARHYIKKAYGARAAAILVPCERNGRWFLVLQRVSKNT